jgi:hypothetical protein
MTKPVPKETIRPEVLKAYSQRPENFVDRDDECCLEIGRDEASRLLGYKAHDPFADFRARSLMNTRTNL